MMEDSCGYAHDIWIPINFTWICLLINHRQNRTTCSELNSPSLPVFDSLWFVTSFMIFFFFLSLCTCNSVKPLNLSTKIFVPRWSSLRLSFWFYRTCACWGHHSTACVFCTFSCFLHFMGRAGNGTSPFHQG